MADALLSFVPRYDTDALATSIIDVVLAKSLLNLGIIKWAPAWKGYAFYPNDGTGYNARALVEVELHLRVLMDAWAREHGRVAQDVQTRRVKRRQLNKRTLGDAAKPARGRKASCTR